MKRGLVIEGGGMRSAYASGALVALQELRHPRFDVVVGTSAGACCAVNFVGGQAMRNFTILHDHLANGRFIRYSKAISRQNVVDIDFLMDEVIGKRVPLPIEEVLAGPTRIFIAATDCSTGRPIYFDAHRDDIIESLRASCAMPYLYRRKIFLEDRRIMDGGVSVSIPIQKAIEEGCDEIVVISTRPEGYRKKKSLVGGFLNYVFFPGYPNMVKVLNERWKEYNETQDWLENPPPSKKVVLIRPRIKLPVTRTTRDKARIQKAFQMGYQDTMETLKQERGNSRPSRWKSAI